MAVTRTVIITSGTTWQVPNTWNNLDNYVICIGGGAGGVNQIGSGGGGGAYARSDNVVLTPNSIVNILIGAGGAANSNGSYTSFASNTVLAQGGRSNTAQTGPWGVGGEGGNIVDSIGEIRWSGGRGGNGSPLFAGAGGGGAGGNTSNGFSGANASLTSDVAGAGGNGGGVDGGNGGTAGAGVAGSNGYPGWAWSTGNTYFGDNYAGGGGGGGSYAIDDTGIGYFRAGQGAYFGGGGGGSGGTVAGSGAQGAIIASWTYQSIVPSTGQISASNVAIILDRTPAPNNSISFNDTAVRDLFRKSGSESEISMADGRGFAANGAVVGTSYTSGISSTITLPAGWKAGDLAVLYVINGIGGTSPDNAPVVTTPGWKFLGPNSRSTNATYGYTSGVFYRVLQSDDTAPNIVQSYGGAYMIVFRNASLATAIQAVNANTSTILRFSGFTKNTDSKKLLTFVTDRDISNATAPAGWTEHTRQALTYFSLECASVNSASYVNGTNIEWTGFGSSGFGQQGVLIEIT